MEEHAASAGNKVFRPRARLLTTLGAELISSEVVAIIELVRNSWDADASEVVVEFRDPQRRSDAAIVITDDGHGMTSDVLLGPWFEPATSWKSGAAAAGVGGDRSPAGRRRLGSKGVGRFATQRLGRRLELVTRSSCSDELRATFDWAAIEDADAFLDEVRVPWTRHSLASGPTGTSLRISDLRDDWTFERFERLRIGLSRLISLRLGHSPFTVVLAVGEMRTIIKPEIDDATAMYALRGRVEDGGMANIEYRDQTGARETWRRQVVWPQNAEPCGPFDFFINAWDLDRPALTWFLQKTSSPLGLRDFRRVIREHAGISLYRDGFRILPYGEPDNDWLRLDRRRVNNPTLRLSNNQILGQIHLSADANPALSDQTNREGLVANDPYLHLQHVVTELLSYLETRRFAARRTLTTPATAAGSPPCSPLAGSRAAKKQLELDPSAAAQAIQSYAGLASIGQLATRLFNQIDHPLRQAVTEMKRARACLRGPLDDRDRAATLATVERVLSSLGALRTKMSRLEPLTSQPSPHGAERMTATSLLAPLIEAYRDDLDGLGIDLEILGDIGRELVLVRAPIQQALANVLENAVYWLCERSHGRRILLSIQDSSLTVSNNGPAIAVEDQPLVFEPHFTRREGAQGLGLTMARDLVGAAGGALTLVPDAAGPAFAFCLDAHEGKAGS